MIAYPRTGMPLRLTSPLTKSENVKQVQIRLNKLAYSLGSFGIDSLYGKYTYNAVKAFQRDSGITIDGVVGPITWRSLFDQVVSNIGYINTTQNSIITKVVNVAVDQNITGFKYDNIPNNLDENFGSYIINLATMNWVPLPVIPEQFSESVRSLWSDTSIPGRSASYKSYQGTANRTLNFSLKLHQDLLVELSMSNKVDLTTIVDFLKSLCYPEYTSKQLRPPVCILKLSDGIKMRGICENVGTTHSLPIKDIIYGRNIGKKQYAMMDIQLSFTEVPIKAPSASDIQRGLSFV